MHERHKGLLIIVLLALASLACLQPVMAAASASEPMIDGAAFGSFSLLYAVAALAALFMALFTWSWRGSAAAHYLTALLLSVAWWAGTIMVEAAATTVAGKLLWSQIAYLGTATTPLLYLLFAAAFVGKEWALQRKWVALLAIAPLLTIAMAFTNAAHGWLWADIRIDPATNLAIYEHGPYFPFSVAHAYIFVAWGVVMLLRKGWRARGVKRRQLKAILWASVLPLAANMLYLSPFNPLPGMDWTVPGFAAASLGIAWALTRLRLLDVAPLARTVLVDTMNAGVLVTDTDGQVCDLNHAMESLLGAPAARLLGLPASELLAPAPELAAAIETGATGPCHTTWQSGETARRYDAEIERLPGQKAESRARLVVLHDVTEREQIVADLQAAQELLQKSRKQYRELVEYQGEGMVTLDEAQVFTFANPAAERIVGLEPGQLAGRALASFIAPESREKVRTETALRATGVSSTYELAIIRPDGERRVLLVTATPRMDDEGRISGTLGVFRDMTEYKQQEQAQARLNDVLMGLRQVGQSLLPDREPQAVLGEICETLVATGAYASAWAVLCDQDGRITAAGAGGPDEVVAHVAQMPGHALPQCAQQIRGAEQAMLANDAREFLDPECQGLAQEGHVLLGAPLASGDERYGVLCAMAPAQVMPEGHETALFGELARDIGEALHSHAAFAAQRTAERQLQEGEQRFQRMIEHASDVIAVIDVAGVIQYVSPAVERMLGAPPEAFIDTNALSFLGGDGGNRRSLLEMRARLMNGDVLVLPFLHADGHVVPLECIGQLQNPDDDPETGALVINGRDISERLAHERALRRRDGILMAASHATAHLLVGHSEEGAMEQALAMLAEPTQATLVSLYQADQEGHGATLRGKWTVEQAEDDSFPPRHVGPIDDARDLAAFRQLAEGQTVVVTRGGLSAELSGYMDRVGAASVVLIPVAVDGGSWGLIALASKRGACWPAIEIEALNIAARAFGAALARQAYVEALRESEGRFRRLAEHAPDVIYRIVMQPEPHFEYISPAAEGITGYSAEEFYTDQSLGFRLVHPDDRHLPLAAVRGEAPTMDAMELRWVRKDGSTLWIEQRNVPILDADGQLIALEGIARDVTGRKRSEAALRESHERFDQLARQTRTWHWEVDVEGIYRYVSPICEELLGYQPHELVGKKHFYDLAPEEDQAELMALGQATMDRGEQIRDLENRMVTKDGRVLWVLTSALPILDVDGAIKGYRGSDIDVTTPARAGRVNAIRLDLIEFAADHSIDELLTRGLDEVGALMDSPIGFFHFVDLEAGMLHLQQWSSATLGGCCRTEGHGKHLPVEQAGVWADCVREGETVIHNDYASLPNKKGLPEDHAELLRELVTPVMREGKAVAILGVGNKQTPYTPEDAGVASSLADVMWEIAVRKRAEEQLRESVAYAQSLLASIPDMLFVLSKEGKFLDFKAEKGDLYASPEDFIGKHYREVLPPALAEQLAASLPQVFVTPETMTMDYALPLAEDERHYSARMVAFGEDRLVALIRDVTTERRAGAELKRARVAAEEANRAKSEFLASMSHEIRTPMNGVLGMTELALGTELTDEQREYLGMAHDSAVSLLGLINDILDFSKIEAGRVELERTDFRLDQLISSTLKPLSLRAAAQGLELACEMSADTPLAVRGDPARLRQVLVNLLSNALKFTEQGEIVLTTALESEDERGMVLQIGVRDTGIGIPEEKQTAIFDTFVQVDSSTTRRYGGTGLGLPISKGLVEAMGGQLTVESVLGQGSAFTFTCRLEHAVDEIEDPCEDLDAMCAALRGLRVLVVDDNATNRRIMAKTLESWGMHVITVESGPAALQALQEAEEASAPFGLMVVDAIMPSMDGYALVMIARQRSAWRDTPFLMVSSDQSFAAGEKVDIQGYLRKPVTRSELFDGLLGVLATAKRAPREAKEQETAGQAERPLRVLLAEDNPVNQRVAATMLRRRGHQVEIAANGLEAMERALQGNLDVILMDVEMPEMDGLEATRHIRAAEARAGRHVPIIAMTAHAMRGDRDKCLAAGMDDYIAKPISQKNLIGVIEGLRSEVELHAAATTAARGFHADVLLEAVSGDVAAAHEILSLYAAELPADQKRILAALAEGDLGTLQRLAHALKGASATVGANGPAQAAALLEQAARDGDANGAALALAGLKRALDEALPQVEAELQELKGAL